ncbi:MAG: hypothetical protein GY811_24400 [Myxococcales bacterium]|nr:hypothetical protein [Myxococcales bacterium]
MARQERSLIEENRGLFRWSFVILALALLVGVLSGASILVAHRMQYRAERALASAKSLGQYVLGARIGSGGMGQVVRAEHALLRRPAGSRAGLWRGDSLDCPRDARIAIAAERA